MVRKREVVKLITFGLGGHTFEFGRGHHLSGYDKPDTLDVSYYAQYPDHDYAYDIPDGTPCLNKIPAVEANPGFAFSSPLLNVDLPDEGYEAFADTARGVSEFFLEAIAQPESFGLIGAMAGAEAKGKATRSKANPGPFDEIGIAAYLRWWKVRGAIVGTVQGGKIVWPAVPVQPEAEQLPLG